MDRKKTKSAKGRYRMFERVLHANHAFFKCLKLPPLIEKWN